MARSSLSRQIRRLVGAFLCAAVLWCIATLDQTYKQTLELPLRVELPNGVALSQRVPSTMRVEIRGSGWELLRLSIQPPPVLLVRPWMTDLEEGMTIDVDQSQIASYVNSALPNVERLAYAPTTLRLTVGPTATRRIPIVSLATLLPREGFDVSGAPRLTPDSVTIVGERSVLEAIDEWPTDTATFSDLHGSFAGWILLGDPYEGMVTAQPQRVELRADVQQVAEMELPDVPLVDRITTRDTALRLAVAPLRVRVLVRGGVRDLERLDPSSVRAYVEVIEGVDTSGIAIPRLLLPPDLDISVVAVTPERVRYRFVKG